VYCTACGWKNEVDAGFCQKCGAAFRRRPSQQVPALTKKRAEWKPKMPAGLALIGGILCLISVFSPWICLEGLMGNSDASAWGMISGAEIGRAWFEGESWAILALVGAILLVAGSLAALAFRSTKLVWPVLVIGGVLAIAGSSWALAGIKLADIEGIIGYSLGTGELEYSNAYFGPGLYVAMAGGALGLIAALIGSVVVVRKRLP
jgi:hypothetical protein